MATLLFIEGATDRQLDLTYTSRDESLQLVSELRHSSEELTRLARTYVLTGEASYKEAYQAVLAQRDGQASPSAPSAPSVALLTRMRQAGFDGLEWQLLSQAKEASDALVKIESAAMAQMQGSEAQQAFNDLRRHASTLLLDASYSQMQQSILQSIQEGRVLVARRTAEAQDKVRARADFLRLAMGGVGFLLLLAYWQSFRGLRRILGGTADEIHTQISRIGSGHAQDPIDVPDHLQSSVLGGLARTQRNLKTMNEAKQAADDNLQRLTGWYVALSLSRQSILRCTDQRTLFEQVCKIAVKCGGMRMAWFGTIDPETQRVVQVASFGTGAELIEGMRISVDPAQPGGGGPSAVVAESDQAFWCQDYQADPFLSRWHEFSRQSGWAGMAALPVHRNGVITGIFYIYANECDAFDPQTQQMLLEMSADFDAALRSLDRDTAQRESREKDALGRFMLERLVSDSPLSDILNDFVRELERLMPGATCSILRLDEERQVMQLAAAPNLPGAYNAALQGLPIGIGVGSCGTAMASGQRVIVSDIATHPYWAPYKGFAQQAGLRSCWSEPILSGAKTVLGSFAVYNGSRPNPGSYELGLIDLAAHLSAIAIERKGAEVQLQLEARVFEQGNESIVITDHRHQIVRVNHAFTQITGYSEAEVVGQNPKILSSGRQNENFYRQMWTIINADDHWQGELWNRRKDGSHYPEWLSISVLRDRQGAVINYVGIATDITQRKANEAQILQLVNYDPLTGLPNRRLLQDRVQTALSHAKRTDDTLALMFVDLDRFKNVNDSLGHHVGDELLIQVASRLGDVLREQDTVCRLGGDEFVLLCPQTDVVGAAHLAEKLLASVANRFTLVQHDLAITFSIGVAMYPGDGDSFEALSMRADAAMYRAKQAGRNAYRFFTAEMQAQSSRTLQLENALSRALELKQLALVYQPQIALDSNQIVGVEALLRWQHPLLGQVSPAEFIPVAEDSGLILPIGEWVLRTAVEQLRLWQDRGVSVPLMAVNLSAVQFRHANLPDLITRVLQESGVTPDCLELELTEGVAMDDPINAIAVMSRLKQCGVRMAIDDFGTGYSSLSYLKRFPADRLKIDQSFVRDITVDPDDKAIVVAIIALARSLGFRSMAEGVETPGQLAFLREQGCDEVQGYLYSRPLTPAQLEAFFHAQSSAPTLNA